MKVKRVKGKTNIAKRVLGLIVLSIFIFQFSLSAQTTEQQQQFSYYWYAAKQAIDQERYADALALLEFCRAIKPNDGQTLTFLGVLYDGIGEKELALETFRQAFEADPRDQWYRYVYALLEQRTEEAQKTAVQAMEKAQKAAPKDEQIAEQLLRLYISDQQWKKAVKTQDKLDKIRGFDAMSALNRYRIYAMWGKPKQAIAAIDQYLEQDPSDVRFLLFRLELMEQTHAKSSDLRAMYERVLTMDPHNLMVLNNYAYHLATHGGDLKKAEQMSALTIREDPDNAVYLDTYGWIMHLQGQNELALFYLKRALQSANLTDTSRNEIEKHINSIK